MTVPPIDTAPEDRLATAVAALQTRYRELAQITAALVEKEAEVAALQSRLAAQERALAELKERSEAEIRRERALLDDMRATTSWRVTKPLRAVGRLLGR